MSNTIQAGYGVGPYGVPAEAREAKHAAAAGESFLDMARQTRKNGTAAPASSASGSAAMGAALPASLMVDLAARSSGQTGAQGVEAAPSLETMLKAKYPNIHCHVFDASSGYWRTRNDYPHYLLYQDGDAAKETLENWQPKGENPFYGSIDGRFTAPREIHALGNVPPGSKAVVIHPKVQERMEQDPSYAQEIYAKIDAWFTFDAARNEAMVSGSTLGMSQSVAIGEDGNICNACSSSPGRITCSQSGTDDEASWWELRMARHAEFMELMAEKQIQRRIEAAALLSAAAAKSRLAEMLSGGNLPAVFGGEIAGVPTETVLAHTRAQVWGGGTLL